MKNYFNDCKTLEEVKQTYKRLAKALHPDAGGDAEEFKVMAAEYEAAFERLKSFHKNAQGETYQRETAETARQWADIIDQLIHMDGVRIEIIGSWIWLTGNTKVYKEEIKVLGFFWSKNKAAWYYTGEEQKSKRRGHYDMNQLREKWGSVEIEREETRKIS